MRYLVPLIVIFQLVTSYYICQVKGPLVGGGGGVLLSSGGGGGGVTA